MKRNAGILLVLFSFLSVFTENVLAQGNLLVAPIRVVFEGTKQKENLNLTNIGQDTAVYLVSFLQYQMQADGSFKNLPDSLPLPTRADKYLRIVPRKVVLPPGESQTIQMQFRKPNGLANGEYRSHLYFRAEKEVTALGMSTNQADSGKMSVSITPIFGISIPVIIRNGNLNYKVTLSDFSLAAVNDTVSNITFNINRTGDRSSYGNFRVQFVPTSGKSFDVGLANGVGVYTDLQSRRFSIALKNRPEQPLKNGKLQISYSLTREEGGTELAKAEYKLP